MQIIFEEGRALCLAYAKSLKETIYYFYCYIYDSALNNSAFIGTALYNKKDSRCYIPQFPISEFSPVSGEELQKQVKEAMVRSVESLDYVFESTTF